MQPSSRLRFQSFLSGSLSRKTLRVSYDVEGLTLHMTHQSTTDPHQVRCCFCFSLAFLEAILLNQYFTPTCRISPSMVAPGSTTLSTGAPPAASESLRCFSKSAIIVGLPTFSHFERSPIVGKPIEPKHETWVSHKTPRQ